MFGKQDFERLESLKNKGFSPQAIYDVGASNGGWTRVISPLFPNAEYHLFEPLVDLEPAYSQRVQTLLEANRNWHLHKVALGESNGSITFNRPVKSPFGSTSLAVLNNNNFHQLSVPIETIDQVVSRGAPVPQLIKLDIQGGELAALKGAEETLPQVELLLVETWFSRGYGKETPLFHEVADWLAKRNFLAFDYSDEFRNPAGQLITLDIFYANRNSPLLTGLYF